MVKDYKKLLRISQVLNNTFGTVGPGGQNINGVFVRLQPVDDRMIKALAVMNVTFTSDRMMHQLLKKYREEALGIIEAALDKASKDYKARFDESIKLSFDKKGFDESTEFYQVNQYAGQSRAFYRVSVLVKVD